MCALVDGTSHVQKSFPKPQIGQVCSNGTLQSLHVPFFSYNVPHLWHLKLIVISGIERYLKFF